MIPEGWITLATVLKPRGNKGEVVVDLHTPDIERLQEVRQVSCFDSAASSPQALAVEEVWMHQDKAIVKLVGVDSINDALALRGKDLCIPEADRRQPGAGEVIFDDLIGCRVFDTADTLLGSVREVFEEGSQVWLQLDYKDALVPWVPAFFPVQDLPNKRLVADLPEGLLEVNQQ